MFPEAQHRRSGLGGAIFALVVAALLAYLAFAALQGEYGLFKLFQIEAQEKQLGEDLAALRKESAVLVNRTAILSTGSLDLDLLEEQSRKVLGLGRSDEIIFR